MREVSHCGTLKWLLRLINYCNDEATCSILANFIRSINIYKTLPAHIL